MNKINTTFSGQHIVAPSEFGTANDCIEIVQDGYKERGTYKKYNNRVEEILPEIIYTDWLNEMVPGWSFKWITKGETWYDIQAKCKKDTSLVKNIEIKTKLEEPPYYVLKFTGKKKIDRSGSFKPHKDSQMLSADIVLSAMANYASDDISCSIYLDSILLKGEFSSKNMGYGYNGDEYHFLRLPISHTNRRDLFWLRDYFAKLSEGNNETI